MKSRSYSIDVLRVFAIISVIGGHFIIHNTEFSSEYISLGNVSYAPSGILYSILILAVNVFFLITGYFGINRYSKSVYLVIAAYIVSFMTEAIYYLCYRTINLKFLLFPFSSFWFLSVYILLIMFHPFINRVINEMTKKDFCVFFIVYLFVWGIQDLLVNTGYISMNKGYSVFHGIAMLIIGGGT